MPSLSKILRLGADVAVVVVLFGLTGVGSLDAHTLMESPMDINGTAIDRAAAHAHAAVVGMPVTEAHNQHLGVEPVSIHAVDIMETTTTLGMAVVNISPLVATIAVHILTTVTE